MSKEKDTPVQNRQHTNDGYQPSAEKRGYQPFDKGYQPNASAEIPEPPKVGSNAVLPAAVVPNDAPAAPIPSGAKK
jgi:hypothetical protein